MAAALSQTVLVVGSMQAAAQPALAQQGGRAAPPTFSVGVADGSDEEVFGFIADLDVALDGSVYVLDLHAQELRWFNREGRFQARAGRPGRGPGEFRGPRAVTVSTDGRVHVLDPMNTRVSTFHQVGNKLVHKHDRRLALLATDLCVVGDRLFVLVTGQPWVIAEVDADGAVVRTFGSAEVPDLKGAPRSSAAAASLVRRHNAGRLVCDPGGGRLFVVHEMLGLVRAFSLGGRSLWRTQLSGVPPDRTVPSSDGSRLVFRYDPDDGPVGSASAIAMADAGHVVVTVSRVRPEPGVSLNQTFEERWLRVADGREVRRVAGRGYLAAVRNGRRYGFVASPVPMMIAY